jgi:5-methylcytosine-specific restriction enzyme A
MSLSTAFNLVLENYPAQKWNAFTGNDLAAFIRTDLPQLVRSVIGDDDRYSVKGSAGQGNWANCPWVAVFDKLITRTAQRGYYVVYLFQEDFEGVYLSLNQGVTTIRERYGADAHHALQVKASDYAAQLGPAAEELVFGPIDLRTNYAASLAAAYEVGNICAKYYPLISLPGDDELARDLRRFMALYNQLVEKEGASGSEEAPEPDEDELLIEDLTMVRLHKRIERNPKLAKQAKAIHGYRCQVCRFDFERHYGPIGREYIEAHHLTPVAELRGQKVSLNPRKDFAVLCANCHRMIHRSEFPGDIQAFKELYYRS